MTRLLAAPPVTRSGLNDQVYDRIREALLDGRLAPGTRLSVQGLADELEVSRSPVAHALTRLTSEGLVSVRSQQGHFVTALTIAVVQNAYEVRLALELLVAERTVGKVATDDLAELRRLMVVMEPSVLRDPADYLDRNAAFHAHHVRLLGNDQLAEVYRRLSVNTMMTRIIRGRDFEPERLHAEHEALVEAYEAEDLPGAQRAVREHVATGCRIAAAAITDAGGAL